MAILVIMLALFLAMAGSFLNGKHAYAATLTPLDSWEEAADTSWYDSSSTSFSLSTPEQLAGLAVLVNEGNRFEGVTIFLANDIDVSGRLWRSIGFSTTSNNSKSFWEDSRYVRAFSGVFNGAGHTISGVMLDTSSETLTGIIDSASGSSGLAYTSKYSLGFFGAAYQAQILNVGIQGSIEESVNSRFRATGGLCGALYDTRVVNCSSEVAVISQGTHVGALAGWCLGSSSVRGCESKGSVSLELIEETTVARYVGGCLGQVDTKSSIQNCSNYARVETTQAQSSYAGGVIGYSNAYGQNIRACKNYGSLKVDTLVVGGVMGCFVPDSSYEGVLAGCANYSSVASSGVSSENDAACVGGVIGWLRGFEKTGNFSFERCSNEGAVAYENDEENACVGGLVGRISLETANSEEADSILVTACYSTGLISCQEQSALSEDSWVGGLFGDAGVLPLVIESSYVAQPSQSSDATIDVTLSALSAALPEGTRLQNFFYEESSFAGATQVSSTLAGCSSRSAAEMKEETFVSELNERTSYFERSTDASNYGFPLLGESNSRVITEGDVAPLSSATYNGCAQVPAVVVYDEQGDVLSSNNYKVTYKKAGVVCEASDVVDAAKYSLIITGVGNYEGSVELVYYINKRYLTSEDISVKSKSVPYRGTAYTLDELIEGVDWVIQPGDVTLASDPDKLINKGSNKEISIVAGESGNVGIYGGGSLTKKVTIAAGTFTLGAINSSAYTGEAVSVSLTAANALNGESALAYGLDYEVTSYRDAAGETIEASKVVEPGTYWVVCTGLGNYSGATAEASFTIVAGSLEVAAPAELSYTGNAVSPTLEVTDSVSGLAVSAEDFSVTYESVLDEQGVSCPLQPEDIKEPGSYVAVITGKSPRYSSEELRVTFCISEKNFSVDVFGDYAYAGEDATTNIVVRSESKTEEVEGVTQYVQLTRDSDYTLRLEQWSAEVGSWCVVSEAVEQGNYRVSITGEGDYYGTVVRTFSVTPAGIASALAEELSFTGAALNPVLKVEATTGASLRESVDYEVTYDLDGVEVAADALFSAGTYTVTISGCDNYVGSVKVSLVVNQACLWVNDLASVGFTGYAPAIEVEAYATAAVHDAAASSSSANLPSALSSDLYGIRFWQDGRQISTRDMIHAGSYTVEVYVLPDYESNFKEDARSVEKTFEVRPAQVSISEASSVSYDGLSHAYVPVFTNIGTGEEINPSIYKASYFDEEGNEVAPASIINAGTYYYRSTVLDAYAGDVDTASFEVKFKISLRYLTMPTIPDVQYTGTAVVPQVALVNDEGQKLKASEYEVWYTDANGLKTIAPEDLIEPGSYLAWAKATGSNYDNVVHWNPFNIVMTYASQDSEERNEGVIAGGITADDSASGGAGSGSSAAGNDASSNSSAKRPLALANTLSDSSSTAGTPAAGDSVAAAAVSEAGEEASQAGNEGAYSENASPEKEGDSEEAAEAEEGFMPAVGQALENAAEALAGMPLQLQMLLALGLLFLLGVLSELGLRLRFAKIYGSIFA
jgi:hypothetical protein